MEDKIKKSRKLRANEYYILSLTPPSPSTEYGFPEYGIREMFYLMFVCQDFLDEVTPPTPRPHFQKRCYVPDYIRYMDVYIYIMYMSL